MEHLKYFFVEIQVIHRRWILTAAHCLDGMIRAEVYLGAINRFGDGSEGSFIRMINVTRPESIIVHPDYDAAIFANDIGLLELPEDAPLDHQLIGTLPFPEGSDADRNLVDEEGTVAGFGVYSFSLNQNLISFAYLITASGVISDDFPVASQILYYVRLPIAANQVCAFFYGSELVTDRNICLNSLLGASACQGLVEGYGDGLRINF